MRVSGFQLPLSGSLLAFPAIAVAMAYDFQLPLSGSLTNHRLLDIDSNGCLSTPSLGITEGMELVLEAMNPTFNSLSRDHFLGLLVGGLSGA